MLNNSTILITGGTGSFGRKFTEMIFNRYRPKKIIVFSRDEYKQHQMAKRFPDINEEYPIRYFLYETSPISLYVILLIDFFFGIFLCACCYLVKHSQLKRVLQQHRKRIAQMEEELVSLRNLPITEDQEETTTTETA